MNAEKRGEKNHQRSSALAVHPTLWTGVRVPFSLAVAPRPA
jgi:hypothetical protein